MIIFKSSERSGEFGFSGRQIKDALDEIQGQHHRMFCPPTLPIHLNIKHFGRIWPQVCQTQVNLNAKIATVMFCGCVPAIRQIMTIQARFFGNKTCQWHHTRAKVQRTHD